MYANEQTLQKGNSLREIIQTEIKLHLKYILNQLLQENVISL